MKPLLLDARIAAPVAFELKTRTGQAEVFHLRRFSVADEQFLSQVEKAFLTPLTTLPIVLRQLSDNEELERFCRAFTCEPPEDITPAAYTAAARKMAEEVPQNVVTALATQLLVFREADQERIKGVLAEKKPVAAGWRMRTLFFCAGVSAGAIAASLLSLFMSS